MKIKNYENQAHQLWGSYFPDEANDLFWQKYKTLIEASKKARLLPLPTASPKATLVHGGLTIPSELIVPDTAVYEQQLTRRYKLNQVIMGVLFLVCWVLAVRYRFVGSWLFLLLNIVGAFFSITYLSDQPNKIRKLVNTVIHINQTRLLCNGRGVNVNSIPIDHISSIIPYSWGVRVFSDDGTSIDVPKGIMNYDDLQSYLIKATHLN